MKTECELYIDTSKIREVLRKSLMCTVDTVLFFLYKGLFKQLILTRYFLSLIPTHTGLVIMSVRYFHCLLLFFFIRLLGVLVVLTS